MNPQKTDFGVYQVDFAALASAASATKQIVIQLASDFIWQKGCFFADIAAATQTDSSRVLPSVTVLMTDSSSGTQLMDNPVPVTALFGTGQIPFVLPNPRKFVGGSTINVTVTNFDAAATYNLRLSFIGLKMFY